MKTLIRTKRAYESASADDGLRVLVDRLWPRGLAKADFKYDLWCKDLAPSSDLRKWFGHKVEHWEKFASDYKQELQDPACQERMREILQAADGKNITLLYAAKDEQHNQAILLADILAEYAQAHSYN